jgi:hypothetical protein
MSRCYRAGWCSGHVPELYWGGTRFESRQDISYPLWDFSCLSSVPPGKFWDNTSIGPRPLPSKSFPTPYSPIHPIIRGYMVRNSVSVVKYTTMTTFLLWNKNSNRKTPPLKSYSESSVQFISSKRILLRSALI